MTQQIDEFVSTPHADTQYLTDLIRNIEIHVLTKLSDELSKELDVERAIFDKEIHFEENRRLLGILQGLSKARFMVLATIDRRKNESV